MKNIFKKAAIIFSLFGLLLMPSFAHAAEPAAAPANTSLKSKILKQQKAVGTGAELGEAQDPRVIIANIIKVILTLVGTIITVLFIYGGYLIMTAGGNEDQVSKGKDTIKNAVIGLVITLTAYSITSFISTSLLSASTGTGAGSNNQNFNQPL